MHKLLNQHLVHKAKLRDWFLRYYYHELDKEDLRYELSDTSHHWSGTMFCCGDIFVDMDTFETILAQDIPCDIFYTHYWWDLENHQDKKNTMNLSNYASMRMKGASHEDIITHMEEQEKWRKSPEAKKEHKATMKKIWDDGMKELERYINKKV